MDRLPHGPNLFSALSPAQKAVLSHLLAAAQRSLESESVPFEPTSERALILERELDYAGEQVSVKRDLVVSKVVAAWPSAGEAAVCPILDFVDEHLADDLRDHFRCLLPQVEWPVEVPVSRVHATDAEWYSVCKVAVERQMFCECPGDEILRAPCGTTILLGAMEI